MTTTHIGLIGLANLSDAIAQRGPRYAITGRIRRDECYLMYADTAERAEQIRARYEANGYHQIRIHAPEGSVDLSVLGADRVAAKRQFDEATALLRAGVLRRAEQMAAEGDVNESALAREAGVDRMTVRSWLGK